MEKYYILDDTNLEAVKEYLASNKYTIENDLILTDEFEIELAPEYREFLETLKKQSQYSSDLIYGKDKTLGIVGLEIVDDELWLFKADGTVEKRPNTYWIMSPRPQGRGFERLLGKQHYKYIKHYDSKDGYYSHMKDVYNKKADCYTISNSREASMVIQGITMYKGLQLSDLGILAFDIEGEGLTHHNSSNVFLITNVFKKNGVVIKKHFRLDHYEDAGKMIDDWCKWVQEANPDIITGHNINGYDLPYLHHVAKLYGTRLYLGRDLSEPRFSNRDSEYRVDGSQSWSYKRISLFGREIIDGMFLAVKYDIGRKYSSWGLKAIAEAEGLVKEGRQFYDASKIAENWKDLNEREKIVQYGLDDAMDSLQLFELMIPSFFMLCQVIPKPFQSLTEGASGSWLNAMMVRSYLQNGYSIPKASDLVKFEGALSYGNPGVYSNCLKFDAASLYPSIMLQYNIYSPEKDPEGNMLKILKVMREERLHYKKLGKQTGDPYYKFLDASRKTLINSLYGFMGASGLNYNYPLGAAEVTRKGREVLNKAIIWATGKDYSYWNPKKEEDSDDDE
jgi:DNA polymerase elongation subunit (family B)